MREPTEAELDAFDAHLLSAYRRQLAMYRDYANSSPRLKMPNEKKGTPQNPFAHLAQQLADDFQSGVVKFEEWRLENERLRHALAVPDVWSEEEMHGMSECFEKASAKHGHYESLMAVGAWLLRRRLRIAHVAEQQPVSSAGVGSTGVGSKGNDAFTITTY